MIGRNLTAPASISARERSVPLRRRSLALSINRMAFFVTSPINMMIPIIDIMFIVVRVNSSASSTPTSDSGSDNMMAKGCVSDSNCDARIRKIRITASDNVSST